MIPILAFIAGMYYVSKTLDVTYDDMDAKYLIKTDVDKKYLDLTTFNTL